MHNAIKEIKFIAQNDNYKARNKMLERIKEYETLQQAIQLIHCLNVLSELNTINGNKLDDPKFCEALVNFRYLKSKGINK
jgi:hypothetical protein